MTRSRKRAVGFSAALVLAAIIGVVAWQQHAVNRELQQIRASRIAKGADRQSQSTVIQPAPPATQHAVHPLPLLPRSREGMELNNDPYQPTSKAEQAWLDRNGFPNSEQFRAFSTATDQTLEQAAASGDSVAKVFLSTRKLRRKDPAAKDELLAEAANGSTFALANLASFEAGSPSGDPVIAYAFSRAWEMKGDHGAATAREFIFPKPLTQQQRLEGEREAVELFDALRRKSSKGAQFVDPRPTGRS